MMINTKVLKVSKRPDQSRYKLAGLTDCGKWQIWVTDTGNTGWFNIIVRVDKPVDHKAAYYLAYNINEKRYSDCADMKIAKEQAQSILEQVHTITGWHDGI